MGGGVRSCSGMLFAARLNEIDADHHAILDDDFISYLTTESALMLPGTIDGRFDAIDDISFKCARKCLEQFILMLRYMLDDAAFTLLLTSLMPREMTFSGAQAASFEVGHFMLQLQTA